MAPAETGRSIVIAGRHVEAWNNQAGESLRKRRALEVYWAEHDVSRDRDPAFGQSLRSTRIYATLAIFTARIWPGRYMLRLAVSLGSKSSTKS
jgi:hypothetical protein